LVNIAVHNLTINNINRMIYIVKMVKMMTKHLIVKILI